jgi:hypothetical protein
MTEPEINKNGARVERAFYMGRERYMYDFQLCRSDDGWKQYDTDQDAWYFGVWVHKEDRVIVTYAEGDETTVTCPTQESFDKELADMNAFFKPAPALIGLDMDGSEVHYYDKDSLFGREVPSGQEG